MHRFVTHSLLMLALLMLALPIAGCSEDRTLGPAAYDYAQALYSVTNRKAEGKLRDVESQIIAAATAGELTNDEAAWLGDIVAEARQGDWKAANRAAREIMEEQIVR